MYLVGPLFRREALTVPRQLSHFLTRAGYVAAFAVLIYTAAQTTFGFQAIRNVSQIARFGSLIFISLSLSAVRSFHVHLYIDCTAISRTFFRSV